MKSFVLSSGSNANCFYVEFADSERFLVDIGLSFKKTKEILDRKGIDINTINAIFLTHEHMDHIAGFKSFISKLDVTFYLTLGTFSFLEKNFKSIVDENKEKFKIISSGNMISFNFGDIFVFRKPHDANEAVGFIFKKDNKKLAIVTDLGFISDEIEVLLKDVDILYIEGNYCMDIINKRKNKFNLNYLNRLVSNKGHLCIDDTCFFLEKYGKNMKKIIICHISENTNTYENVYLKCRRVIDSFDIENKPELFISFQGKESDWI